MTASIAARRRTLRPFFTADRRFPGSSPNCPETRFYASMPDRICRKRFAFPLLFVILLHHGSRIMSTRFLHRLRPVRGRNRPASAHVFAADAHRPKSPHFAGFHAVAVHVVYHSHSRTIFPMFASWCRCYLFCKILVNSVEGRHLP